MMSELRLEFGDVVRVSFPFADKEGVKERPAVVVSSALYHQHRPDILVMALSGRLSPVEAINEKNLVDWQEAGLSKPSRLKAVVATVAYPRIIGKLGALSAQDRQQLQSILAVIFTYAN